MTNYQLNYFHLKLIAIFAMTLDHIAWIFVETASTLGQSMHFFGRITAPMMCFLLVEGYFRSRDLKKYALRLLVFALLSQLPYVAMLKGWEELTLQPELLFFRLNILFNLLLGLLALITWRSAQPISIRISLIGLFLLLSTGMDWGVFIILFVLVLAYFREQRKAQIIAYLMTAMALLLLVDLGIIHGLPTLVLQWMPLGVLIVPLFWYYCNDQMGLRFGGKYFFYLYYPAHMLLLSLFKLL